MVAHHFDHVDDLGLRPRQHALSARGAALRPDRGADDRLGDAGAGGRPRRGRPSARATTGATYGTTLAGLMRGTWHRPRPLPDRCARHRPFARLAPDPALARRIAAAARAPDRLHQRLRALCRTGARRARAERALRCGLRRRACGLPSEARPRGLRDGLRRRRPRPAPAPRCSRTIRATSPCPTRWGCAPCWSRPSR